MIEAAEEELRLAEEAAKAEEEALMQVLYDSANMGETVVIIAEEEASDEVGFDEEGNIVEPSNDQDSETKLEGEIEPEGETEVPTIEEETVEEEDEVPTTDETAEEEDDVSTSDGTVQPNED